eukprot:6186412-Pleurochrysis_carterae.AAC.2
MRIRRSGRCLRNNLKPAMRLHARNFLLQRREAMRKRDEVRKEHGLQAQVNLKANAMREAAEHAVDQAIMARHSQCSGR